jgi:hypothetical protein
MHKTGKLEVGTIDGRKQVKSLKKTITYLLFVIIGIILGAATSIAVYYFSGDQVFQEILGITGYRNDELMADGNASNAELTEYAYQILGYIQNRDYVSLSEAVHPEFGVVFSPYATINLSSNKYFTAAQVAGFGEDKNIYVWGKYDGSGDPIELTPTDYFNRFVFDKDYTGASEIGIDSVVQTGNALENIKEMFPDIRFVDFHISGVDDKLDGLDWSSLRLGFEEYNGVLKLTVILHSEWTI